MGPKKLWVNHRFKELSTVVMVEPDGEYYADSNFSEMRAIIRDQQSDWRKPCSVLFPKEVGGAVSRCRFAQARGRGRRR